MTVEYRRASDADREVVRSLLLDQHLPVESIGTGATDFYVALLGSAVVGAAGFEYYGEDVLLRSVVVPSHLQNQGRGSQLVDWMIRLAKNRGKKRIVLLTESAQKFFEKKNFLVVQRAELRNEALMESTEFKSACPLSAVCMVLNR